MAVPGPASPRGPGSRARSASSGQGLGQGGQVEYWCPASAVAGCQKRYPLAGPRKPKAAAPPPGPRRAARALAPKGPASGLAVRQAPPPQLSSSLAAPSIIGHRAQRQYSGWPRRGPRAGPGHHWLVQGQQAADHRARGPGAENRFRLLARRRPTATPATVSSAPASSSWVSQAVQAVGGLAGVLDEQDRSSRTGPETRGCPARWQSMAQVTAHAGGRETLGRMLGTLAAQLAGPGEAGR